MPSSAPAPLRLTLGRRSAQDRLDGGWWPHSRDLDVELADLVDHFPPESGRIVRVIFSRPDWDTAPHQVTVAAGTVKAGSFPEDDTHEMMLRMSDGERVVLLVVPPDLDEAAGAAALADAATDGNSRSGTQLLAAVRDAS